MSYPDTVHTQACKQAFNLYLRKGVLLRWFCRAYRVTATSLGTLLIPGWVLILFKPYIESFISLPNGFRLVPAYHGPDGVPRLDRDGAPAVTFVENITWRNDVIYGARSETVHHHPVKNCGKEANVDFQGIPADGANTRANEVHRATGCRKARKFRPEVPDGGPQRLLLKLQLFILRYSADIGSEVLPYQCRDGILFSGLLYDGSRKRSLA